MQLHSGCTLSLQGGHMKLILKVQKLPGTQTKRQTSEPLLFCLSHVFSSFSDSLHINDCYVWETVLERLNISLSTLVIQKLYDNVLFSFKRLMILKVLCTCKVCIWEIICVFFRKVSTCKLKDLYRNGDRWRTKTDGGQDVEAEEEKKIFLPMQRGGG